MFNPSKSNTNVKVSSSKMCKWLSVCVNLKFIFIRKCRNICHKIDRSQKEYLTILSTPPIVYCCGFEVSFLSWPGLKSLKMLRQSGRVCNKLLSTGDNEIILFKTPRYFFIILELMVSPERIVAKTL